MAEDQPADVGGEPTFVHSPGGTGPLSPRDAARSLTDARAKANAAPEPDKQPERAPPATAAEESAPEADATRRDEGHGEDVRKPIRLNKRRPSIRRRLGRLKQKSTGNPSHAQRRNTLRNARLERERLLTTESKGSRRTAQGPNRPRAGNGTG